MKSVEIGIYREKIRKFDWKIAGRLFTDREKDYIFSDSQSLSERFLRFGQKKRHTLSILVRVWQLR